MNTRKQITQQKSGKRSQTYAALLVALLLVGLSARPAVGAAAGRYAYVSDSTGNLIYEFSINASSGVLTALATCPSIFTATPGAAQVDPTGRFLYVANKAAANAISWFTITPATGCLTASGTIGASTGLQSLAIGANGACLFVANASASLVEAYTINPLNGSLVSAGPVASTDPSGIAVDPLGQFVYVSNYSTSQVSGFTTDLTTCTFVGTVPGTPLTTGSNPLGVALDPVGQFLLVTNSGGSIVTSYPITPSTGALGQATTAKTQTTPDGVSVNQFGQFLFVADYGAAKVSSFTINPTNGVLTVLATTTVGTNPTRVSVDQTGRFLFVADSGSAQVSAFTIKATTGALTAVAGSPYSVGVAPVMVATTP